MNIRNNIPSLLIVLFLLALLVWVICGMPNFEIPNSQIENKIQAAAKAETLYVYQKAKADTIYKDRLIYRERWREIRANDSVPCGTKITICDTLILKDDSLIVQQRVALLAADSAIGKKNELIGSLEKENRTLSKKLKRARFWNRILAAVGIGAATAALTNR